MSDTVHITVALTQSGADIQALAACEQIISTIYCGNGNEEFPEFASRVVKWLATKYIKESSL